MPRSIGFLLVGLFPKLSGTEPTGAPAEVAAGAPEAVDAGAAAPSAEAAPCGDHADDEPPLAHLGFDLESLAVCIA